MAGNMRGDMNNPPYPQHFQLYCLCNLTKSNVRWPTAEGTKDAVYTLANGQAATDADYYLSCGWCRTRAKRTQHNMRGPNDG